MPAPQNKGELQSFLGMVTYLSSFTPQLSSHTATLRGLLKTDVEYSWNATYQVTFDKLKSLVCEDTTLRYFNMKKPWTIQVDASGKGLGATLIQDDGPVAFTSKALIPMEQHYANNERELLTCIFGAEHFWTYVFRWFKFTLKPPYSIACGKLQLAIWDTSFWTFFLKFGHKGPWDIS